MSAGLIQLLQDSMKTAFLALLLLSATAALAQAANGGSVLSSEPVIFQSPNHPKMAGEQGLAIGTSLLEKSGFSYGHGERPLWEINLGPRPVLSLGEAARIQRKEHEAAPKAQIVWTN